MARKTEKNYFEMMKSAMKRACDISERLSELISELETGITDDALQNKLEVIRGIERSVDRMHFEIIKDLSRAFITPIEREDILLVTNAIGRITDALENVACHIWMFNIKKIRPEAKEFVKLIKQCCVKCYEILDEFENYKKSKSILQLIREMDIIERDGDMLYYEAVRKMFTGRLDAIETQKWRELYHNMESCFGRCRDLSQSVGNAVIKNS